MHTALTIAGSDSSGGAGVQADLKTMLANGVFGESVITALTAQNTMGVDAVMNVPADFIEAQMKAVFTDIFPDAVKIGMTSSVDTIEAIAAGLVKYKAKNIVLDPVMVATSGSRLLEENAANTLMDKLFPLADIITPNIPELEVISGRQIGSTDDIIEASKAIYDKYGCPVLSKGGHFTDTACVCDYLWDGKQIITFETKRVDNPNSDEEHHKLSKRCGHSSFEDLLDQGFLTEAIVNFVALLGWSPSDNQEIMSLPELVEKFDYHHMSKSPAVFDFTKLKWMNGEYIKKLDFDKFYEMALPYIKEVVTKDYDLKKIARMVQTRIEIFPDIKEHIDFFEELPDYDIAMYTHKKMKTNPETSLEVLNDVVPILESCDDFSNDALFETLKAYATEKGYKIGYVMWPIRTAVSGKQMTPGGATELMEVFGKEESIARIKKGIEKLSNN